LTTFIGNLNLESAFHMWDELNAQPAKSQIEDIIIVYCLFKDISQIIVVLLPIHVEPGTLCKVRHGQSRALFCLALTTSALRTQPHLFLCHGWPSGRRGVHFEMKYNVHCIMLTIS
jgi:hypothetical protein